MSVSTGPGDCLRHRCSSAYLRISLLHAEFHPPLPYSSDAVTKAIASDEIGRLAVSNAAEALGKTPGTSVVDGKYVVIRGLGDRYTNTQMNGTSVPSADPDKRAVQMDQFPSDVIDSITTLKSFTPDQPGAFSGGSVNIKTKSFPEQFFFTASAKTAYTSGVTGEPVL